ncbi:MAG: RluA family pseudouridine synthase [Kiritimatiellae bacterium]|nr:RluA family pseudouridine synthase [Kiritimatiellia bacterium]MDW8457666.1 RluA family pseudouridine synthase [Verrucomicrobiota bacterium]
MERGSIVCGEQDVGRLDSVLARARPELSRARWQEEIKADRVTVNGRPGRCKMPVKPGDIIEWTRPPPEPTGLEPEPIPLSVIYEDEDLIAIDKPPGLVVHPAPGHPAGTLVNALLHHCPNLPGIGGELRPGLVHRLDRDTSGVMVVAKNDGAMVSLARQFKDRRTRKEYLALVWGRPRDLAGTIHTRIARSEHDRKKMAAYPLEPASGELKGKEALSRYEVLETIGPVSLVRVRIETGRTHQIRVHMSHIRHPVVGDPVYGGSRREIAAPRQMLHAERLELIHPRTGTPLVLVAPIPADFQELISQLKQRENPGTSSRA